MWLWTCSKLLSDRHNLVFQLLINHHSVRGALFYNTHAIIVFSSELLLACSSVFEDCSCISCLGLCEVLQYFLPNMIVGNIVKVGGHHKTEQSFEQTLS